MNFKKNKGLNFPVLMAMLLLIVWSCQSKRDNLVSDFKSPPDQAKPWVFWYWLEGAVSHQGIHADLEAMKDAGIGGAYLMPIKGATNPPWIEKPVIQLTPEWWQMVLYAMNQADSLGLQIAMHVSDGFALAGGPWITPELSMQKVVWSKVQTDGGHSFHQQLPQPPINENYYEDIAVYAFPVAEELTLSSQILHPKVTTSLHGKDVSRLTDRNNQIDFETEKKCWIQYAFKKPFTCRSITIRTAGNKFVGGSSYQSQRLLVEVSDDGKNFHSIGRLKSPRIGWEDWDEDATHEIVPVTARYFRFVYDPEGSEPGAEDLDAAKWRPELKISNIELNSAPSINQYEGKDGLVWRIADRTTREDVPDSLCIPMDKIINLTDKLQDDGTLKWEIPAGHWTIVRMGHTSNGHRNETGGGGKGLECDKFNPEAVKLQFNHWYGEILKKAGPELAPKVLSIFHVDSWECGSQNWSPVFAAEFKKRRGYDLMPYLPVLAGIPVQNIDTSERFLHDIRQTISELVADNFYHTLADLVHKKGIKFSAECVAPTMVSDGLLHYREVDIPMGEFWLRSPTHDKPNDILDGISGAHIYGKPLVQAEAFTEIRLGWDEHPALLKSLGDLNYALGINRFVYHVFMENPWLDRKPGMSLNGVGSFLQRDQTWWKPGKAWVKYAQRCQAVLQRGEPVVDVAVFTGEEIPSRSVLPDRLVPFLPGIFGEDIVKREQIRLRNEGTPVAETPEGVFHSANMAYPEDWTDPLKGYAYDSFNPDALLRLATVHNGRVEMPGGASYGLLVIPGARRMMPEGKAMSIEVARKLLKLVEEGATILVNERPDYVPGLGDYQAKDDTLKQIISRLWNGEPLNTSDVEDGSYKAWKIGKGRVIQGPYQAHSFKGLGINPDVEMTESGEHATYMAWNHRKDGDTDIYFISNQKGQTRTVDISLRVNGKEPEFLDPVTGEVRNVNKWEIRNGRTNLSVRLNPNGSVFIVLRHATSTKQKQDGDNWEKMAQEMILQAPWEVAFDPSLGGPKGEVEFSQLVDWTTRPEDGIRYYSGTANYKSSFNWQRNLEQDKQYWLNLGQVNNIAEVTVNGVSCGVAWTSPYQVNITKALKAGENEINIAVSNTWANRMIGDHNLPAEKRITWTNAPYRLEGHDLLPAGLLGPVVINSEKKD
ncbi:glycosyl hydrolase [Sunxiuqinia indica]|uniref:glycosyl hydrolase n=1 Tax=Sunxiuqinia indica TaxID=2692584 RepID=UPI0013595B18|nr:glycosyl hydrolase [Sunxiuqinia indica]